MFIFVNEFQVALFCSGMGNKDWGTGVIIFPLTANI